MTPASKASRSTRRNVEVDQSGKIERTQIPALNQTDRGPRQGGNSLPYFHRLATAGVTRHPVVCRTDRGATLKWSILAPLPPSGYGGGDKAPDHPG